MLRGISNILQSKRAVINAKRTSYLLKSKLHYALQLVIVRALIGLVTGRYHWSSFCHRLVAVFVLLQLNLVDQGTLLYSRVNKSRLPCLAAPGTRGSPSAPFLNLPFRGAYFSH